MNRLILALIAALWAVPAFAKDTAHPFVNDHFYQFPVYRHVETYYCEFTENPWTILDCSSGVSRTKYFTLKSFYDKNAFPEALRDHLSTLKLKENDQ